jgi:quercetin dioxygenase-like cupin family protein
MKRILILAAAAVLACSAAARADDHAATHYQNLLTPLLQTGEDVLGTPLSYPEGPVAITAAIVTVPPGGETGWHSHEVPLFGHILEGELTIDYGEKGTKVFRAGDSLIDAINWPHNGTNTGAIPTRLLAVYMGGGGLPNATPEPAP